ncbi:hypothetical protein DRQ50_11575, partial [bacterium]
SLTVGAGLAGLAYVTNNVVLAVTGLPVMAFALLIAPGVEELSKATWLDYQVRSHRTGFLADATIIAFATGAGFATVENLYYLRTWPDAPLLLWAVRGLGTAVMHGGAASMFAIVRQTGEAAGRPLLTTRIMALGAAVVFHGGFNALMGHALPATAGVLVLMTFLIGLVHQVSERRLRRWLGHGLDRDRNLLELISAGEVHTTPLGRYLLSLREHFGAGIVTDMLCLLRLEAELSIRAKGTLMLREHGFTPRPDQDLEARLAEHRWLMESIGRAGLWALGPVRPWHGHGAWQRRLVESESATSTTI